MDSQEKVSLLTRLDLFRALSAEELQKLALAMAEVEFPAGATVCAEGDTGADLFVLLAGELQVFKHHRLITTLTPIDYLGEMALIEDQPRSATVVSVSDSRLLRLAVSQFNRALASQPQAQVAMMRTLSRRLRRNTELLAQEYEKANILIHDMKNGMTAFLLLDLLEAEGLSPFGVELLTLLKKGRREVTALMDEALANAKRLQFTKERPLDSLVGLLADLRVSLSRHPDLRDKPLLVEGAETVPELPFNRLDIGRVITNLVLNAGQASPSGSPIAIRLSANRDWATVEVVDQGHGVPETIRDLVFLPNFTTKDQGHGLGLASCKEIVETVHGGKLSLTSNPDRGATFRFTLPLAPIVSPPFADQRGDLRPALKPMTLAGV